MVDDELAATGREESDPGYLRNEELRKIFGKSDPTLERAQALWDRAYEQAARNAENGQKNTAREGGKEKLLIVTMEDGKKYVKADRLVVFGNNPNAWSQQLEDYINSKIRKGEDVHLFAEDGDILTLTAETAGKVASMYDSYGRTMPTETFERKVNAGSHIDELAKISERGKVIERDRNGRHGVAAEKGWKHRLQCWKNGREKYSLRCRLFRQRRRS